jgi:hypothetical protein
VLAALICRGEGAAHQITRAITPRENVAAAETGLGSARDRKQSEESREKRGVLKEIVVERERKGVQEGEAWSW